MEEVRSADHNGAGGEVAILTEGDEALRRSQQRLNLLAEAGRLLGSALDYEATLADVCRLVVPTFADWCTLDLVAVDGTLQRVEVAHKDPERVAMARDLHRRYPPRPESPRGLFHVLRTGEPSFAPEVTPEMLAMGAQDEEHLRLLLSLGLRSAMIVPLRARGRTLGALTLIFAESGRRYDENDLQLGTELAGRIGLAVDNARLFAEAQQAVGLREEALELHCRIEERLQLLVEASGSLSASLDVNDVAAAVLALSRRLIAADAYAVWRYQPASGRWGIAMGDGLSEEYQQETIEVVERSPKVPEHPLIAEDVRNHPFFEVRREAMEREGIRSTLLVPLCIRGERSGTLVFYYREPHRFDAVEVAVATALSNLAGSAIGSAELYDEVRANNRRKDEFLAMLAHELRNPLSAISNAAHLIRASGPMSEPVPWGMELIGRQVHHLIRLIDDLLDVSRITRGKIRLRRVGVDVGVVISGAMSAVRRLVEERGHRLEVACEPGLSIEADPTRLEQIVVNLLTNAAKYTEPGGSIALRAGRELGANEVVIRVRDTGVGIPPEQLPRMFELFVQGERTPERAEGGLGIGLTLVRRLTEMHGGTVQAHSDGPGLGAEFVVRLPASREAPMSGADQAGRMGLS